MPLSYSKKDRRKMVWAKTGGRCAHCGRYAGSRSQTVDHFVPRAEGGPSGLRNLMPLCTECNKRRGDEPIDPRAYYKYAPEWVIRELISFRIAWRKSTRSLKKFS